MLAARRRTARRGAALAFAAAALAAAAVRADVAAVVVAGEARPVPQARVELLADGRVAFTDARGAFTFTAVEPPAEVLISHPRYETATFTVTADGPPLLLAAKREVYDAIEVSAELGQGVAVPPTLAIADLDPVELAAPPGSLAEIVATVPGVAEAGQGGAFQVFSIRGVAGQRVLTRVSGAPLHGERRAGVETSFLDPLLVGAVEVVRGPSGTYQGSGALGGVVEVFPRRREGWSADLGWASQGDEVSAAVGWGGGPWSIAAAWRDAGDAETARGERLFSRFERTAASVERAWEGERADWTLVVVPSATREIGKPNTDFPRRTTLYPAEDHLLASLSGLWRGGWHATTWLHPHAVDTRTREADGSRALVENDAFDLGARLEREVLLSPELALRAGAEYSARRGVDATETAFDAAGRRLAVARPLAGAGHDDAAAFASLAWSLPGATLEAGARFNWLGQENGGGADAGAARSEDTAWNGFAGAVVPLGGGFQATANLGTGMRWPTLSERFFSGTTGRGGVVANPGLHPERSLQGDLGLAWFGRRLHLSAHVFRNRIDDFVEQVDLPSPGGRDVSTFVNLGRGTIEGVEVDGFAQLARGWMLGWGAHAISGESDAGEALADVPADRAFATLEAGPDARLAAGRLTARLRLEHRAAVDHPGPGERPIPSATLLSGSLAWRLRDGLAVALTGTNLTDELWLPAADEKAVPAAGRSVGMRLRWAR